LAIRSTATSTRRDASITCSSIGQHLLSALLADAADGHGQCTRRGDEHGRRHCRNVAPEDVVEIEQR
jgi:hypothetical protein